MKKNRGKKNSITVKNNHYSSKAWYMFNFYDFFVQFYFVREKIQKHKYSYMFTPPKKKKKKSYKRKTYFSRKEKKIYKKSENKTFK